MGVVDALSRAKTGFGTNTLAKFLVSGASTALLFTLLCFVFAKCGLFPLAGTMLAYAIAFAVGYTLQRWWTFKAQHSHTHALPRYFVLQVGCGLMSGAISQTLVSCFAFPPLAMAIATAAIVGGASFVLSRYWVFR